MSARDDYERAPLTQATYEAMCDEIDRLQAALAIIQTTIDCYLQARVTP